MKLAIMGLGGRGQVYAHFIKYFGEEISAVCDADPAKIEKARSCGVPESEFYTDEDCFFEKGRLADALIIATMDSLHYRHIMRALDIGYDVLVEKPIAMTLSECIEIENKAKSLGRRVAVCHVLRFAPLFMKTKDLIDSGCIGDIVSVELTENIGYYHFAHSFCRGNWRNTEFSAPLIVAKNCHDTDMICWLIGKKCLSVSSFGSLKFFHSGNAPKNSAENCFECPLEGECIYSAKAIYTNEEYEKIANLAKHGKLGETKEEIEKSLSDKENLYGRCVFRCDNNVVDNQIVNMQFEDGIVAQLKTTAFTNDLYRVMRINGTKGVIYTEKNDLYLEILGGKKAEKISVGEPEGGFNNHSGGDVGIIRDFISYVKTGVMQKNMTAIEDSIMGHKVAFLAEKSRLSSGELQFL